MAQITHDRKSSAGATGKKRQKMRTSCFHLGCFGGGGNYKKSIEKGETTRSSVWFSWKKLIKTTSFPRKTVPIIDSGGCSAATDVKGSIFHLKFCKKKFLLLKDQNQDSSDVHARKIVRDDQPNKTKYDNVQEIILENSKSKNLLDSLKKPTCKKGRINKCTSEKMSRSTGNLVEDKFEVAQLSHSATMAPPAMRKKTVINNTIINSGGDSDVSIKEKTNGGRRRRRIFDQSKAETTMIMVTLTLTVMVFCGKICAIFFTCVCFYFCSAFVRGKNQEIVGQEIMVGPKTGDEIDFNSPEYKKKVVLEGILKRNYRI